MELLQQFSTPK